MDGAQQRFTFATCEAAKEFAQAAVREIAQNRANFITPRGPPPTVSFSVVGSVNHLVAEYRRFLLSTYRLADPRLREQFESHIKEADVLVKGPYVTLANDFARERMLEQLHEQGVGHKDLQRLKWSFGDKQLFLHQEQSLPRLRKGPGGHGGQNHRPRSNPPSKPACGMDQSRFEESHRHQHLPRTLHARPAFNEQKITTQARPPR